MTQPKLDQLILIAKQAGPRRAWSEEWQTCVRCSEDGAWPLCDGCAHYVAEQLAIGVLFLIGEEQPYPNENAAQVLSRQGEEIGKQSKELRELRAELAAAKALANIHSEARASAERDLREASDRIVRLNSCVIETERGHAAEIKKLNDSLAVSRGFGDAMERTAMSINGGLRTAQAQLAMMGIIARESHPFWSTTTDARAIGLVMNEAEKARVKHNASYERMISSDKRLRIMVEEVGEIARAIEDIGVAERAFDRGEHKTIEEGEKRVAYAHEHLDEEIAQVGSLCVRWLSANAYGRKEET